MKIFGQISELLSLVYRKDSQAITLRPNQATTYTAARDQQLPPGDTAHVLVSATSTQTLTNKSIDADTNTITNIENADIKAAAAIDATKIADGSVSNAEFQALNGVTGNITTSDNVQTLTNKTIDADGTGNVLSNIDDGNIKAAAAIDTTKLADGSVSNTEFQQLNGITSAVVGISDSQTLTNKTIDGDLNTITDLGIASLKTVLADADKVIRRDAAGAIVSDNLVPNSSALVTIDAAQVITAKDIDGGTASNTSRTTLPKNTTANLAALTRKQATIAYDTTLNQPVYDTGSAFVPFSVAVLVQEYVYNTDLANGNDTTSFASGIGGGQFGNFSGGIRSKRVQFATPITQSDIIQFEYSQDTGVTWLNLTTGGLDTVCGLVEQAGNFYGVSMTPVSSTEIDVKFGNHRKADAGTYGGAGSNWSDIDNDPVYVWRVRKISG